MYIASGWYLHFSLGLASFRSKDRIEYSSGKTESPGPVSAKPEHISDSVVTKVSSKPLRCFSIKVENTKWEGKWQDILSLDSI